MKQVIRKTYPNPRKCDFKINHNSQFANWTIDHTGGLGQVVYLDGINAETTKCLLENNFCSNNLHVPNPDNNIVKKLKTFDIHSEPVTLAKYIPYLENPVAAYLDYCQSIGGSVKLESYPINDIAALLKKANRQFTLAVTFCQRYGKKLPKKMSCYNLTITQMKAVVEQSGYKIKKKHITKYKREGSVGMIFGIFNLVEGDVENSTEFVLEGRGKKRRIVGASTKSLQ